MLHGVGREFVERSASGVIRSSGRSASAPLMVIRSVSSDAPERLEDHIDERMQGAIAMARACDTGHCKRMGARQRRQPVDNGPGQLLSRLGTTGAQLNKAGREREEVLHAMVHFAQQQRLPICRRRRSVTSRAIFEARDHIALTILER